MALTQLDLCNMALSKIGNEGNQITNFTTDTGKVARQCRLHYEPTLNELVRMHSWNCTKARDELVLTGDTPDFGWTYEYDLPASCLRPLQLAIDTSTQRALRYNAEWVVEGKTILTNEPTAWLSYIAQPAAADMDSLFAQAFYTLLASKLAIPVTGDIPTQQAILNEFYSVVMPEARRVNAFEGYESPVVDSDWLEATFISPSSLGSSWPPFGSSSYGTLPY